MKTIGYIAIALIVGGVIGYFLIPHPKPERITVVDSLVVKAKDIEIRGLRGTIEEVSSLYNDLTLQTDKERLSFNARLAERLRAADFYYKLWQRALDTNSTVVTVVSADTLYDDGEVKFRLHSQYAFPPFDVFNMFISDIEVKAKYAREVEYRENCEWSWWNGFVVSGDASFGKLSNYDARLSMPIGIVENWRLTPHVGYSRLQESNFGFSIEWGIFK